MHLISGSIYMRIVEVKQRTATKKTNKTACLYLRDLVRKAARFPLE